MSKRLNVVPKRKCDGCSAVVAYLIGGICVDCKYRRNVSRPEQLCCRDCWERTTVVDGTFAVHQTVDGWQCIGSGKPIPESIDDEPSYCVGCGRAVDEGFQFCQPCSEDCV